MLDRLSDMVFGSLVPIENVFEKWCACNIWKVALLLFSNSKKTMITVNQIISGKQKYSSA